MREEHAGWLTASSKKAKKRLNAMMHPQACEGFFVTEERYQIWNQEYQVWEERYGKIDLSRNYIVRVGYNERLFHFA